MAAYFYHGEDDLLVKKAENIIKDIKKIIDKRKYIYDISPFESNIKIEMAKKRCEHEGCPFDHTFINITADYILGEEILNIFRYLKRNKLASHYRNGTFCIVLM